MTQIMQTLTKIGSKVSNFINTAIARNVFKIVIILALVSLLFYLALGCIYSFITPLPKPIILGVRTFAYGMGNNVKEDSAEGFCGTFGKELKKELDSELKLRIKIKYLEIVNEGLGEKFPRYYGLKHDLVHIECRPNSASSEALPEAQDIQLSKTFYETGVKLLLRESLARDLESNLINLSKIQVGAFEGSTTLKLLYGIITNNNIHFYPNRDAALNALNNNQLEAFASDSLIVKNILEIGVNEKGQQNRKAYKNSGYTIYPRKSYLTADPTEMYVMAVKKGTKFSQELIELINQTLQRQELYKAKEQLKCFENSSKDCNSSNNFIDNVIEKVRERFIQIVLGLFVELAAIFIANQGNNRYLAIILCVLGLIIIFF